MMREKEADDQATVMQIAAFMKERDIERAYLFGSFARGTSSRRSDIDLIVIENTDKPFFDRYDPYTRLILGLPNPVDLLIYTPVEWEEIRHRPFFRNVLKDGKVVYER